MTTANEAFELLAQITGRDFTLSELADIVRQLDTEGNRCFSR